MTPAQADFARKFGPLDGAHIPGGCDHCDCSLTVNPVTVGVWMVDVYHDRACPTLATVLKFATA